MIDRHIKKSILRFSASFLCLLLFVSLLSFGSYTVFADGSGEGTESTVDPVHSSDGYSAVLYDNKSGLPTSDANAIAQTEEGFIWIGSYSGLIRYDGNTFVNLSTDAGISSVVSLFVDSSNRLWIGTNDSGISVMHRGQFRRFNRNEGLKSLSVRTICEDKDGNIIVGTTEGIYYIDKHMVLHQLEGKDIADKSIRCLKPCGDGTIYGITLDGCVFTLKDRELADFYEEKDLSGIKEARSVLPDADNPGYLYIGDSASTIYYGSFIDGKFSLSRRFLTGALTCINSIENYYGYMWACTDKGIGYFSDYEFTPIEDVPMTNSVETMLMDHNNNIWFASSQQGVMKIVPNQFTDIFNKYKIPEGVVYSTCVQGDSLYVGTKNEGLIVIKGGKVLKELPVRDGDDDKDLIEMLSDAKIRSINTDSKGNIWFSTFSDYGLICYKDGRITKIRSAEGLPSDRVRTVFERPDGALMVCCTGGLAIVQDGKVTKVYDEKDGITNTEILTASMMENGEMVLGTDGGGIYVITANGVQSVNVSHGLSSDVVMRVKKDLKRNIMWVVTSNSIGYLNADYDVTTIRNFPYLNNFDFYQNSKDEMWVLSSNGVYVANTEDILKEGQFRYLYYGIHNGLPGISTSNSYSELTSDGYLYMSCTSGITRVNIEKSVENINEFKASVPFIEADGVMIYPNEDGSFTINASTHKLTVYCYVFNYSLINPDVTYQLVGFDQTSVTVARSNLQPVDYTNLKGGKYSFKMVISDSHTGKTHEVSVPIVKQQLLHEHLWFNLVILAVLGGVLYVIVKIYIDRRTKKLIAKNNEQKKLIREVVEAFARVIDMKDKYTRGHSIRVAHYTAMLAKEMGRDEDTCEKYYNIALLHDIGKIGIPEEVLNKPGKLNDEEFATIKSHSALGFDTLKDISIMPELAIGAGAHHERPDGKGYPRGLKHEEIPDVARIIAVADTFDAMYSNRPYRNRMPFSKVYNIITEVSGTQLDSEVVNAFVRLVEKGYFRAPDDDS